MRDCYSIIKTTNIGRDVSIGEFCVIEQNVRIGNSVRIHPHVVIYDGCEIGEGVEVFPGAFLGREPKGAGVLPRRLEYERMIRIGNHTSIGPNAVIYYDVQIGGNCLVGDAAAIREKCRIADRCVLGRHVSLLYNVTVGEGTRIMTNAQITGNVRIGERVFISVGVSMANDRVFGAAGYRDDTVVGPTISDDAKIGAGAVLLPGVTIGRNAVVGAGAVVTRDVADYSVVMGIPARHVRYTEQSPCLENAE